MNRRESFGTGDLAIQQVSTSNLISGGASADYDTLKEIEDKMKQLEASGSATQSKCNNYDAALEDVSQLKEDITSSMYVDGCPYIKELYINEAGKKADLSTLHLSYCSNKSALRFSNTAKDKIVAATEIIDPPVYNVIRIIKYGGSDIYGYVIIDWRTLTKDFKVLTALNERCYHIDYSPCIKEYLDMININAEITNINAEITNFNDEVIDNSNFENLNRKDYIVANNTGYIWFQYVENRNKKINKIDFIAKTGTVNFYLVTYDEGASDLSHSLLESIVNYSNENGMIKSIDIDIELDDNQFIGINGSFAFVSAGADHRTRNYNIANNSVGGLAKQNLMFNAYYDKSLPKRVNNLERMITTETIDSSRIGEVVLYKSDLKSANSDIIGTQIFDSFGLVVNSQLVLNKFYGVSDRTIKYVCKFGNDTVACFSTVTANGEIYNRNTIVKINVSNKTVQVQTLPVESCNILNSSDVFIISITKHYQNLVIDITNMYSGSNMQFVYTTNGTGGVGSGAIGTGVSAGMQYDYYAFELNTGSEYSVSKMIITCAKCDLLIYGDSISEPEAYWPTDIFGKSWTQLVIKKMNKRKHIKRIYNTIPYVNGIKYKFI